MVFKNVMSKCQRTFNGDKNGMRARCFSIGVSEFVSSIVSGCVSQFVS